MIGLYMDPRHERSIRLVFYNHKQIVIYGFFDADEPHMEEWSVKGKVLHKNIKTAEVQFKVNFATKDVHHGDQKLLCTINSDRNIVWSDGNMWLHLSTRLQALDTADLETQRKRFLDIIRLL